MLNFTREKLLSHLRQLPRLADLYSKRDPNYVENVNDWLLEVEKSLLQVRSPLVALSAAQRSAISAVRDGYRDPETSSSATVRKTTRVAATLALTRMESKLRQEVHDIDVKFDLARDKLVQLIAVSTVENPIPLPPTEPRSLWLQRVWSGLNVNTNTQGMYTYLSAALSSSDRLYLLDEVLNNLLSMGSDIETVKLASKE